MDQHREISLDKLVSDACYLCDELQALKNVIEAVPYSEKPVQQDSILDMICKIDLVQRMYLENGLKHARKGNLDDAPLIPDVDSVPESHNDNTTAEEPSAIAAIDAIIDKRRELLNQFHDTMQALNHKRDDGSYTAAGDYLHKLLYDLVYFERKQLKEVAERVLSIDTERV